MGLITRKTTTRMAEANRANAKVSTGPKTAIGTANSRRNSTKHGILAEKLPPGIIELEEDAKEFEYLRDGLNATFRPEDEFERLLVGDMASIRWRLMRVRRAEAQLQAGQRHDASGGHSLQDSALLLRTDDLDRLIRYEAHLERQFERKLQQLLAWRKEPFAVPIEPLEDHNGGFAGTKSARETS